MMRPISRLKNTIVPAGVKPRKILAGPFKGIMMNLCLQNQSQIYLGLFEKETHPALKRLSRGLATAIDIGAAFGEYTLFFLLRTKAEKIFAFEPDPVCLPIINENLGLNGLHEPERLNLSTTFLGESDNERQIRLDNLASSIKTPCLIKMDVDGGKERILRGATELNKIRGVRWLIETHSRQLEVACVDILKSQGFRTAVIPNAWWRFAVPEQRPLEHNRWLAAWND